MNVMSLFRRACYFFWFFALPIGVAWGTIDILVRSGAIEEVEVWYVLLLFVILAFTMYMLREKLPFWKDPDPNSPSNCRRRNKDAVLLLKSVRKIIAKKGHLVSKKGMTELTQSVEALSSAIDNGKDKDVENTSKALDKKSTRYLSAFRKSAPREYFESIGVAVLVAIILRLFVLEAFKIPSESMVPTLMVGDHIFVSKYRYGLSVPFSNKRIVRFAKPDYGEVIVFLKPSRAEQNGHAPEPNSRFYDEAYEMVGVDFIKRIVGLPGDEVSMRRDVLRINGKPIPRCHVGKQIYRTKDYRGGWVDEQADLWLEKHGDHTYMIIEETGGKEDNIAPRIVPDDQVFVLGDNRDNSRDSRFWGSVPFDNIKGRAMFIWWSNRRPYGFQWDRVGTFIMDDPDLTKEQEAALARCPNMR